MGAGCRCRAPFQPVQRSGDSRKNRWPLAQDEDALVLSRTETCVKCPIDPQMSGDRTVNLVTDFVPRTTDLGVGHPAAGEGGAYSVTFPSKYLGVAVGASPAAGIDATANAYTLLSSGTTATVTSQQVLAAEVPTILVSVDGSNSWARATGAPDCFLLDWLRG